MSEDEVLEALVMGDVDAKDITTLEDGRIKITGEPTDLNKIKTAIETMKEDIEFDVDDITTTPQEYVELNDEDMAMFERLMGLLNDCDDVDDIYDNVLNYDDGEEE